MNARWFPLRYHPVQQAYSATILPQSPYRFIALPCGRRSGKTELSKRRLIIALAIDRGRGQIHQYRAAAPTLSQARDLFWEDLKALCPREWITDINESRLEIDTYVAGVRAKLKVIGTEKAVRAEGSGYDGIVLDESSDIRPGIFNRTFMPALADRAGWAVRQGVPKRFGVGAQEYREFCELGFSGSDPITTAFAWPSWDILSATEIEIQKRLLTEDDYNEQFGAKWLARGSGAFHSFDATVHVRDCQYDPTKPILVGCDFNVSPMGWALCHSLDGKTLEVFDELFLNNTWTQQTLDKLWDKYQKHQGGWFFYGDATSKNRNVNASSSSYAQIVNDRRFRARVDFPDSNPNPQDRLTSCNLLLRNAAGEVRCWIDPRCSHLIADLSKRMLDDKGNPAEGISGDPIGHISDGWGYLVHRKWPSTIIAPTGKAGVIIDYGY